MSIAWDGGERLQVQRLVATAAVAPPDDNPNNQRVSENILTYDDEFTQLTNEGKQMYDIINRIVELYSEKSCYDRIGAEDESDFAVYGQSKKDLETLAQNLSDLNTTLTQETIRTTAYTATLELVQEHTNEVITKLEAFSGTYFTNGAVDQIQTFLTGLIITNPSLRFEIEAFSLRFISKIKDTFEKIFKQTQKTLEVIKLYKKAASYAINGGIQEKSGEELVGKYFVQFSVGQNNNSRHILRELSTGEAWLGKKENFKYEKQIVYPGSEFPMFVNADGNVWKQPRQRDHEIRQRLLGALLSKWELMFARDASTRDDAVKSQYNDLRKEIIGMKKKNNLNDAAVSELIKKYWDIAEPSVLSMDLTLINDLIKERIKNEPAIRLPGKLYVAHCLVIRKPLGHYMKKIEDTFDELDAGASPNEGGVNYQNYQKISPLLIKEETEILKKFWNEFTNCYNSVQALRRTWWPYIK